jgi:hypothetical protein
VTFASNRERILRDVEEAFWQSAEDVLADAQRRAKSSRLASSGSVERRGHLQARILFDAPFAKARERGAYIAPKRRRALKFADGGFRMAARLPKKPYLVPAAKRWGTHLVARLRGIGS